MGGGFGSSLDGFGGQLPAQAVAAQVDAVGVVDEAIEDGIGERWVAGDQVVPAVHRDLAGDQRGATAVAVLGEFQQVARLLRAKRLEPPVIQDQQLHRAQGAHQPGMPAIAAGQAEIGELDLSWESGERLLNYVAASKAQGLW